MSDDGWAPTPITAEVTRVAMRKVRDEQGYHATRLDPIHPQSHAKACRILGVPEGSPLTHADVWRAAMIEYETLPQEEKDRVVAAAFGFGDFSPEP